MVSCSQDDALQTTVNDNDGLVPVTLSATIEHGVQTRATSTTDDKVDRCLLQIIESDGTNTPTKRKVLIMEDSDGTYTATAMLNPNHTYTFLFWADGGDTYYTAEDLEEVTIADGASGAGIAWYGKATWSSSESTTIEAELKHAVAKVTLQSTTEVPATMTATISGVKEYSTFNVLDGTVSNEASFTHSGNGKGETGDVFSFYALVDGDTQDLTLQTGDQPAVIIPSVPLAPNKHVILTGDVANAGLTEYTFTATIDTDWASSATEGFPKIYLKGGETLTEPGDYIATGSITQGITINGEGITLTLDNATISVSSGNAISVESGNPTIHVKGTSNSVTGNAAGIYVAENSTVTITGDSRSDQLTAKGNNGSCGIGGYILSSNPHTSYPCGDIFITNVTVYAHGSRDGFGSYSPGIGSAGNAACGAITIDNATATAYGYGVGGNYRLSAPAIGCGIHFANGCPSSIPVVIIQNDSEVHAHRGINTDVLPTDYIGWPGDGSLPTDANSTINCGEGGGVYNSIVYCYTGETQEWDKMVIYDENGNGTEQ